MIYLLGHYSEHGSTPIQWILKEKEGVFELHTVTVDSIESLENILKLFDVNVKFNEEYFSKFQYGRECNNPFSSAENYSKTRAAEISSGNFIDIPIGYEKEYSNISDCYRC